MTRAEELIHRFGLNLQNGGLVSERPLAPEEVAAIRPHRRAILRALTPPPIPLIPMLRDSLEDRTRPAVDRMEEALEILDGWESQGIHPVVAWRPRVQFFDGEHGPVLGVPAYLRPELLWLLREAVPAVQRPAGLGWLESGGGAA